MKRLIFALAAVVPLLGKAQNPLPVPDTIVGGIFNLNMHRDSIQFLPGQKTRTLAFNTASYLGPTLILGEGTTVNMAVNNQIGDTTTVHWHGLHIAAINDGGPHTTILPGATWTPQFKVMNSAATCWYHPHLDRKTAKHAMMGAAGMIIIRDAAEAALLLPRSYGIDDIPLVVQTQQLDLNNQIEERGMEDSVILVNGTLNPYRGLPAQVVRLRLLNASGERNFNFGFSGNKSFYVIGNDEGLLPAPVPATRIRLAPGERAEILLDLSGMSAQSIYLMSYASEIPMGVQGGPTMPMPGNTMNSPLNGMDFNILRLDVVAATAGAVTSVPASLIAQTPLTASQANGARIINFTADNAMVMDGPFYFNDSSFDMSVVNYRIPLNSVEIWSLTNKTMVAHPFHLHGTHFWVLDRDGNLPPAVERGKKDVVLVAPDETVRIIAKFEHFADTVPYMYHCHILMHEDDGMMGQYIITSSNLGTSQPVMSTGKLLIYPNPADDIVRFSLPDLIPGERATIVIRDFVGHIVYESNISAKTVTVTIKELPIGAYTITAINDSFKAVQKLIVRR